MATVSEEENTVDTATLNDATVDEHEIWDRSNIDDSDTLTPEEEASWTRTYAERYDKGVSWPIVLWIGLLHVGAIGALFPYLFSWTGVAIFAALYFLNGCIGITLGFHRLLTHNGFKTYPWVRHAFAFIGGLAGEGSALDWVAMHRKHHAHSDQDGDPHSPLEGGWWAHMMWLFPRRVPEEHQALYKRWAPDFLKDPVMMFFHKTFIVWHVLMGVAFASVGYYFGGFQFAASLVIWGMFFRLTAVLHNTWLVNSATHMWGYRNYETTDKSTNLWWVGIMAFGEGWHNNHHAYPRMAVHGHKWWEIDITYNIIRLMKVCGLAWDVVDYKKKSADGSVVD
ncbi:MAG: acyl-CoA desaturase [Pirellulales bacterium]|jgi:fatty-acid desaturase